MPKVSILLTSYNHADYLRMSIDSILNQTFKDFELIIVDDCSSDNSWDIIKSYDDNRIIKIRNKRNKGYAMTRDLVKSFRGEYFAIAHCDDCWEKEKLAKQVEFLDNNANVAACFTYVKLIDDDNNELDNEKYVNFNVENRSRFEWLNHFFYHGNCLCHPSILMRKNVQLEIDLFTFGLRSLPDFYRWVKLCLHYDIYIYPEKLTCFRVRRAGLNTSGYSYDNMVRCAFEITKVLELYEELDDDDFLKVFPQAKKYKKRKYFNSDYALARICIDEIGGSQYVSFGFNLLYKLFQNDETRDGIIENYNYTKKEFVNETGSYDIFSVVNKDLVQNSSLYYALKGKDYNEEDKVIKRSLIKGDNSFEILFSNVNLRAYGLRIDLDEGVYRSYFDVHIYVNGEEVNFTSNCSYVDGDKMFFYHKDPILFVNFKGNVKDVYVTGKSEIVDVDKMIKYHEMKIRKEFE